MPAGASCSIRPSSDHAPPVPASRVPDSNASTQASLLDPRSSLAERLQTLQRQLPPSCRLLAVSKGQPVAAIREAYGLGVRSFAESRLQEAAAKQEALADLADIDWHFIGRLQANKARAVLQRFPTVHSLDSLALAERLQRIAAEEALSPAVLLQVKLRPDPAKGGFEPSVLRQQWPLLRQLTPLRPIGLMTIPPLGLPPAERQRLFSDGAALAAELGLTELSMGMSDDWPEAMAAGSTWVRLGTALFGGRGDPQPLHRSA